MKVLMHRRARADLAAIRQYIAEQGDPNSAQRVGEYLQLRIRRLGRFPGSGLRTNHPAIRILSPTRYPYRIYFTVTETAVIVLHVRHTSRDLPDMGELP